jgi:hypothetical protein
MACDSHRTIAALIAADQKYINTCWLIYVITLSVGTALSLVLHFTLNQFGPTFAGFLATGMAFPIIPKHMQRSGALDILKSLSQECFGHEPDDPHCKRIADNVDVLLRSRGGV